jgi:hypothetical protein
LAAVPGGVPQLLVVRQTSQMTNSPKINGWFICAGIVVVLFFTVLGIYLSHHDIEAAPKFYSGHLSRAFSLRFGLPAFTRIISRLQARSQTSPFIYCYSFSSGELFYGGIDTSESGYESA